MSQGPRRGRAGVLTGLLVVIAVSCSSDIVELLPPTAGAGSGGGGSSAGQDTMTSGANTGGNSAAGATIQGGSAGAPQAGGGNGGNGGNGGDSGNGGAAGAPCFGFGCGGESGVGGSFGGPYCGYGNTCAPCVNDTQCPFEYEYCANNVCVQCTTEGPSQCWQGGNCDVLVRHCEPRCDTTSDCKDGRVCDLNQGTCVWCIDNRQCEKDGAPGNICYLHRCVECTQDPDCTRPGEGRCSGTRCVQCLSNMDCNADGKSHCNVPKGYCE